MSGPSGFARNVHGYIRGIVQEAEERGLVVMELDGTEPPYSVEMTPEAIPRGAGDSVRIRIEGRDPLALVKALPHFSTGGQDGGEVPRESAE